MNFCGFHFDGEARATLEALTASGRLPHAVIIESKDIQKAGEAAALLSAYAVCQEQDKPCGVCRQCQNALRHTHADIQNVEPDKSGKTKTYKIDQIRALAKDAQIRPNDADAKVYIFEEADTRFPEISQNAFLKLLEEPPQRIYFFLLCRSAKALLTTIRSRCAVVRLSGDGTLGGEAVQSAEAIAGSIVAQHEYELLKALSALNDKEKQGKILAALRFLLRDALALLSGGDALQNKELGRKLASKLTRAKLLAMLELCGKAEDMIKQNININLLTTWLCGEFRRILWQR